MYTWDKLDDSSDDDDDDDDDSVDADLMRIMTLSATDSSNGNWKRFCLWLMDWLFAYGASEILLLIYLLKLMADGPSFWYEKLIRESWHKKFLYKLHTEPSKFLVQEAWRMTETIKNFKFLFFRRPLHNQQNGQKDEKGRNN